MIPLTSGLFYFLLVLALTWDGHLSRVLLTYHCTVPRVELTGWGDRSIRAR